MENDTYTAPPISKNQAFLTLGLLSLIWGTSFILIKKSLVAFSPSQVACLRMSISAIAFLPVLAYKHRQMDWSKLPFLLIVGLTGSGIPAFLFSTAQLHISSTMAGILNSLTPLFTFLLGVIFFKVAFGLYRLLGVLLGLVGAILLIAMANSGNLTSGNAVYGLLIVLSSICYATSSNVIGKYLQNMNALLISAASFGLVAIPLAVYLFAGTDFLAKMESLPEAWTALGYIFILSMMGTVAATIVFFRLIQQTSPVFGSTVAYLMPVVALGWGLADGERVGWAHLIGMVFILSGVYLSRR